MTNHDDNDPIKKAAEEFSNEFFEDETTPKGIFDLQVSASNIGFTAGVAWRDTHPSREMVEKIVKLATHPTVVDVVGLDSLVDKYMEKLRGKE